MSYQNLTLRNIAGEMTAIFNDGTFRSLTPPDPRSGSTAAFIGTAATGVSHEFYEHTDRTQTFKEFGSDSEIAQMVQSAKEGDVALPVIVARIGAKNYSFSLQRATADGSHEKDDLIQIVPLFVQEKNDALNRKDSLESIKAVFLPYVEDSLIKQRVILGTERQDGDVTVLFDSERKLATNGGAIFDVSIEVPVGEILITNEALKDSDKLSFNDAGNVNSFEYNNDTSTVRSIDERIALLKALNEVRDFDWSNSKVLDSAIAADKLVATDVMSISVYENVLTDIVKDFSGDVEIIKGAANKEISNYSKRYAGVDLAYSRLEFENPGYIYCEGCYADVESVDIDSLDEDLSTLNSWTNSYLGNLWKFVYKGREYSYMFSRKNPFDADNVLATYSLPNFQGLGKTITFNFSPEQRKLGDLLNLVEVHFHEPSDAADEALLDVETFVNKKGMIECHITLPRATTNVYTDFFHLVGDPNNDLLWGTKLRLRPSLTHVDVSTGTKNETLSVHLRASDYQNDSGDWRSNDPFVMTHYDLTGQFIPEAVTARLVSFDDGLGGQDSGNVLAAELVASEREVREISFLHQSAQAAFKASTNYSQTLALIPTSAPKASNSGLREWAGEAPTYELDSTGELVVKTEGSGIMGNKLLSGRKGYRNGKAFGGIILTNGNNLPNQIPYGIDDQDEARDDFGQAIDLGKHCIVVGAWGLVSNPENALRQGGRTGVASTIHVNAAPRICGILNSMPPGNEPIGPVNGRVFNFQPRYQTERAVLNDLAFVRVCMIDESGVISSIYSAAHPTSDYRKISSTMAANAILGRLREVCAPYIGRAYKDEEIASLSQTIDGTMKAMVAEDYAQRIEVSLSASRFDRINGVLKASVTFVPPLSLEAINLEITLDAPSAGI
jgi:hypothetical protein